MEDQLPAWVVNITQQGNLEHNLLPLGREWRINGAIRALLSATTQCGGRWGGEEECWGVLLGHSFLGLG